MCLWVSIINETEKMQISLDSKETRRKAWDHPEIITTASASNHLPRKLYIFSINLMVVNHHRGFNLMLKPPTTQLRYWWFDDSIIHGSVIHQYICSIIFSLFPLFVSIASSPSAVFLNFYSRSMKTSDRTTFQRRSHCCWNSNCFW